MTASALLLREVGYARRTLLRDPESLFLTVGLPLLYLLIFDTVFGDQVARIPGQPGTLKVSIIMTASVIVIGVVSAAFQNLAISLVQDRENGVLKRLRSAPVPTWLFLGGQLVNALLTAVVMAVGVAVVGFGIYGVPLTGNRTAAAAVTLFVGAAACAGAAIPFTRLITKSSAAPPVTAAAALTLFFISGNFFAGATMPRSLTVVADLFPVSHFTRAMTTAFNPTVTGGGFAAVELLILGAWAVGGALVGLRVFRWTPTGDR
jgi:ABC-2 type transport system permease protein